MSMVKNFISGTSDFIKNLNDGKYDEMTIGGIGNKLLNPIKNGAKTLTDNTKEIGENLKEKTDGFLTKAKDKLDQIKCTTVKDIREKNPISGFKKWGNNLVENYKKEQEQAITTLRLGKKSMQEQMKLDNLKHAGYDQSVIDKQQEISRKADQELEDYWKKIRGQKEESKDRKLEHTRLESRHKEETDKLNFMKKSEYDQEIIDAQEEKCSTIENDLNNFDDYYANKKNDEKDFKEMTDKNKKEHEKLDYLKENNFDSDIIKKQEDICKDSDEKLEKQSGIFKKRYGEKHLPISNHNEKTEQDKVDPHKKTETTKEEQEQTADKNKNQKKNEEKTELNKKKDKTEKEEETTKKDRVKKAAKVKNAKVKQKATEEQNKKKVQGKATKVAEEQNKKKVTSLKDKKVSKKTQERSNTRNSRIPRVRDAAKIPARKVKNLATQPLEQAFNEFSNGVGNPYTGSR